MFRLHLGMLTRLGFLGAATVPGCFNPAPAALGSDVSGGGTSAHDTVTGSASGAGTTTDDSGSVSSTSGSTIGSSGASTTHSTGHQAESTGVGTTSETSTGGSGEVISRRCSLDDPNAIEICTEQGGCDDVSCPDGFACLDGFFCSLPDDLPLNLLTNNFQHHLATGGFVGGEGDFIVVLQALGTMPATYLRRFDADGVPAGVEFQLGTDNYLYAQVAGFGDGRYVTVHEPSTLTSWGADDVLLRQIDLGSLGGNNGRFSVAVLGPNRFVAAGTANWAIFNIDDGGLISLLEGPHPTPAGGVPQLLAFRDGRFALRLNGDTWQRFDGSGVEVGDVQGSGLGSASQSGADVIVDEGGGQDVFAVTYAGAAGDVRVRAYDWAGTAGSPIAVGDPNLAASAESLDAADLVGLPDGSILAVYQQVVNYEDRRIIGQRLDREGVAVTVPTDAAVRIDRDGATARRYMVSASRISNQRIVVSWIYYTDAVFYHARAQILHYLVYP